MKKLSAILIIVSIATIAIWFFQPDRPLTADEVFKINQAWNPPRLEVTRGEAVITTMAMLQAPSGLSVDTSIPIWGVILVLLAAVAAFAAVKMQMTSHEKSDDERFNDVKDMLAEIRSDVKVLMKGHK